MFTFTFPPEIEDRIFKWAALLVPHNDQSQLTIICKRLQTPVEYIMYESLLFAKRPYEARETAHVERFAYTLNVRPTEFFATRVRNICIMFDVRDDFAQSLMAKCTGARCVAFWIQNCRPSGFGTSFLPLVSTLVGFSTDKYTINEIAASGVVFPHVQYLGLMGFAFGWDPLLPLDWLPNLLTMRVDVNRPHSDQWLEDTKLATSTALQLQMVIFDVDPAYIEEVISKCPELSDEADIWVRNRNHQHLVYHWREFAYKDEMIFS